VLRAVLDSNVIVSGMIAKKGIPAQLLEAWRRQEWHLVVSPHIVGEVQRVLSLPKISRTYGLTPQDIADLVWLLEHRAILVPGRLAIPRTVRDPQDDPILACAQEGEADYIVTGDLDLLSLERHREILIVTPARFAALLAAAE